MQFRAAEIVDNENIYAVFAQTTDEDGDDVDADELVWMPYGYLPEALVNTPGVLREWRSFNRAVIDAFMRHYFGKFEVIDKSDGDYAADFTIEPDEES